MQVILFILLVSLLFPIVLFTGNLNIFDKIGLVVATDIIILNRPKSPTYMFPIQNIFQLKQHIKDQVPPQSQKKTTACLEVSNLLFSWSNKSVSLPSIIFMVSIIRFQPELLVEELSPRKQILNYLQMQNLPEMTYNFQFHPSSNK